MASQQPPGDAGPRVRPMVLFRWGLSVSLGVLATAAAAAAVYTTRGVLTEALIALFLAISLDPAVRMLMRWRIQRGVAILVALGLTAAFLQSVIPALVDQFQANTLLARLPGELGGSAVGFTRRTFSTLASAVLVAVLTIYFLADLPRLQRGAVLLFPRAHRDRFVRIVGVMVDNGAVICITVALFASRLWPTTVLVLVFFVMYQQVENYLIAPRIMRGPVQLSAGAVLLAGLTGASAMGLIGALMAIPSAAGIKVLLSERLQARDTADAGAAAPGDGDRPDDATPG